MLSTQEKMQSLTQQEKNFLYNTKWTLLSKKRQLIFDDTTKFVKNIIDTLVCVLNNAYTLRINLDVSVPQYRDTVYLLFYKDNQLIYNTAFYHDDVALKIKKYLTVSEIDFVFLNENQ